ncbi:MAG: membrane protease YdiL (CAAX protease family) [Paracoccaceae bacterium]|jgi:membrane protease YdiL (CAAX protease family)
MRTPQFESFVSEARLYPELWRVLLGLLLIGFMSLSGTALLLAVASMVVAAQLGPMGILPFLYGLVQPDRPVEVVLLLGTFGGMFLGVIVAAGTLHFRTPRSLFGPFGAWARGFGVALGVIGAVYGVMCGLLFMFDAPVPNLDFGAWLRWMPVAIALLFVQIAAEELVFRGYLQQQLAARFKARWIWFWGPAVIFAGLHWAPEAGGNLPLVLLSALTFGAIAADLTEKTGTLGAAMGLHFGHNFMGLFVVAMADTLTGLALFVSPEPIGAMGAQSLSMGGGILLLVAIWWVTRRILMR